MDPQFRPLFTVEFTTTPQIVGTVPAGHFRRAGIITGGSFTGERLSGRVLPGDSDWGADDLAAELVARHLVTLKVARVAIERPTGC